MMLNCPTMSNLIWVCNLDPTHEMYRSFHHLRAGLIVQFLVPKDDPTKSSKPGILWTSNICWQICFQPFYVPFHLTSTARRFSVRLSTPSATGLRRSSSAGRRLFLYILGGWKEPKKSKKTKDDYLFFRETWLAMMSLFCSYFCDDLCLFVAPFHRSWRCLKPKNDSMRNGCPKKWFDG